MVQHQAQQIAQQMIEEELGSRDEHQYIQGLEEQNKDWLYEADGTTPTKEGLAIQVHTVSGPDGHRWC